MKRRMSSTQVKQIRIQLVKSGIRNCWICKKPLDPGHKDNKNWSPTTLEHIVPLCQGGTNDLENLTLSHEQCNLEKSKKECIPSSMLIEVEPHPHSSIKSVIVRRKFGREWIFVGAVTMEQVKMALEPKQNIRKLGEERETFTINSYRFTKYLL